MQDVTHSDHPPSLNGRQLAKKDGHSDPPPSLNGGQVAKKDGGTYVRGMPKVASVVGTVGWPPLLVPPPHTGLAARSNAQRVAKLPPREWPVMLTGRPRWHSDASLARTRVRNSKYAFWKPSCTIMPSVPLLLLLLLLLATVLVLLAPPKILDALVCFTSKSIAQFLASKVPRKATMMEAVLFVWFRLRAMACRMRTTQEHGT